MEKSISYKDYMLLADAYDKHSRTLMSAKGEEYSLDGDFLAMENRLAGMLGKEPEYVSLVMAGKHITAIGIILDKNKASEINLEKLDERIRDASNLLKIASAFIHAKQNDFSLHLGKEEKPTEFVCPVGWVIALADHNNNCGWYVSPGGTRYLHKNFIIQHGTGHSDDNYKFGEAPGYWPTKEAAEDALKQYLEKTK